MCGIYGVFSMDDSSEKEKYRIQNSTDVLKHRGPDDFGYHLESNIFLGHRRLSIIDLSLGKQPIYNENRKMCIVFNGEIFNFQEIKKELEARGHVFSSSSDTEVIIHSYEEHGRNCVDKFRGMFAFAIWDTEKKRLFVARDRLGIKPLFYAVHKGTLFFASEMKAILQNSDFPREIDFDGLAAYFSMSYIPAPMTIFKKIRKLLPGHTMEVHDGKIEIRKYWDLRLEPDHRRKEKSFIEQFDEKFDEAVRLRLIGDVPVGAFLSGGVDSGAVVARMASNSDQPVRTFTMGFGGNVGGYLDERQYARIISAKYGTVHHEYEISPDIRSIIPDVVRSFDEPFADASVIPSFYISKLTRESVKVALSGLGGDELFGGYERYLGFKLSSIYHGFIPEWVREKVVRRIVESLSERKDGHYTVNHLKRFVRAGSLPGDLRYLQYSMMSYNKNRASLFTDPGQFRSGMEFCRNLYTGYFNSDNARDPLDRAFYCDIKTYLPEDILACTDRMSMRHSLEVRVPFLDHKLVEFSATIPSELKLKWFQKKYLLKRAMKGVLPREVISHRKQGFIGPMTHWTRNDIKADVKEVLCEDRMKRHGLFNTKAIFSLLEDHFSGREIHDKIIWALIMFQFWHDEYIDNRPSDAVM